MTILPKYLSVLVLLCSVISSSGQAPTEPNIEHTEALFGDSYILPLGIRCSKKQLQKETNDSTYIDASITYRPKASDLKTIDVKMRARGNFRKQTCFFTPLKVKIQKSKAKATLFEGEKRLKIVLPCLNEKRKDDDILKEYLIYKMYEIVSPYFFKTRLVDIDYESLRNRKIKSYKLKGFFIEDDSKMAKRLDAKVLKRQFSPQGYDDLSAVRNAMFHYMIGNTDFSTTFSHNSKVIYVNKKFVPVSYDFDLAGFVNSSYAVVSKTRKTALPIEAVTQRYYMGYQRDNALFEAIRQEFLKNKDAILTVIDQHESYFDDKQSFETARRYIRGFFDLASNKSKFMQCTYEEALKIE